MNTDKGQPIVLVNLFFIVACMIWASLYYTNHVSELREVIDSQDTAIIIQQEEIDMLYRVFLPHVIRPQRHSNPLYNASQQWGGNSDAKMNNE